MPGRNTPPITSGSPTRRSARSPTPNCHGQPILVRCDGAGATKEWLTQLRRYRDEQGLGPAVLGRVHASPTRSRTRSRCCPNRCGPCAVDAAGKPRPVDESGLPVAQVAELTLLLPGLTKAGWPAGMRVLVRRERPHPGATISVFEAHDGWRYQCVATDTGRGQLPFLEARHRAHARVEDRVKAIKQTGMGRFPSREFDINQVWLQLALTATDLIAWTQTILLARRPRPGRDQAAALPAPAHRRPDRPHGQRKIRIKIDTSWPWANQLAAAFTRLDHDPATPPDSDHSSRRPSTTRGPQENRTPGRPISLPIQTKINTQVR